jgi:hypothetical protein
LVVVPAEKAEHVDNIIDGLAGCQQDWAGDGVWDGMASKRVFKKGVKQTSIIVYSA